MNQRYNILMYWTNIYHPTNRVKQNISEQTLIKDVSLCLYASFGTFCVQIGQLFESQWAFEECLNIDKSSFSKEMYADFGILPNVQRLTAPLILGRFGRKSCQKKREDVNYQFLWEFFQKYFDVNELWAGKNSFSTYVIPWIHWFEPNRRS